MNFQIIFIKEFVTDDDPKSTFVAYRASRRFRKISPGRGNSRKLDDTPTTSNTKNAPANRALQYLCSAPKEQRENDARNRQNR